MGWFIVLTERLVYKMLIAQEIRAWLYYVVSDTKDKPLISSSYTVIISYSCAYAFLTYLCTSICTSGLYKLSSFPIRNVLSRTSSLDFFSEPPLKDHIFSAMSNDDTLHKVVSQHETDGSDTANKTDITDIKVELAAEEHAHLSVGDILRGTAAHELTPFERKAALINA